MTKKQLSSTAIPKKLDFWSFLKIWLLIMISFPFWFAPLLLNFVIKAIEHEQHQINTLGFYFSILPLVYAYGSFLVSFMRIQRDKVNGKLRPVSFGRIFLSHGKALLQLIGLQSIDLVLNRFSGEALFLNCSLQLFYFFAEITEYFYRKILLTIPVNQRMLRMWHAQ
jgi:hypothetical protein